MTLREIRDAAARKAEERAIRSALRATKGNVSAAARVLGCSRKCIQIKMAAYGLRESKR